MFRSWIVVTIVLRNLFQPRHPELKTACKVSIGILLTTRSIAARSSPCDEKIIPCRQCLTYPRRKKSDGARPSEYDDGGEPQAVFDTNRSTVLSHMHPCIVCVKNEFSPASLRAKRNQCCENMITVVIGINSSAIWEGFNEVKIPMYSVQSPSSFSYL
jgi:hypothetical protein